jgi:ankyrin repeat protein
MADAETRTAFLEAALWHGSLESAQALLADHPELAAGDIHTAAVVGDAAAVRTFVERDAASVNATSEPYGGEPLVYLCLSKYLRLDASRTDAFVRAATALLDAGADPNSGFWTRGQHPERETALYGAAGVAHHAAMTRLLLERGADPNDGEAVYHSPETRDNAVLRILVETGRLTPESLRLMLVRKIDWHDYDGVKYLLEHGVDGNLSGKPGRTAMHQALVRDNSLATIVLLLDHGADPSIVEDGITVVARAAREGRSDVLRELDSRGVRIDFDGVDRLIAACAVGDTAAARAVATRHPALVGELTAMAGELLAKFAGTGNAPGVRALLDVGVDVRTTFAQGDGYYGVAKDSLAIHVAAWRAQHAVVKLLIERGSPVDVPDAKGRTPLALAVKACVDSYWTEMRSPDSVDALLKAGASVAGVPFPCGYAEVDELLHRRG